jgi:hypothetical protein
VDEGEQLDGSGKICVLHEQATCPLSHDNGGQTLVPTRYNFLPHEPAAFLAALHRYRAQVYAIYLLSEQKISAIIGAYIFENATAAFSFFATCPFVLPPDFTFEWFPERRVIPIGDASSAGDRKRFGHIFLAPGEILRANSRLWSTEGTKYFGVEWRFDLQQWEWYTIIEDFLHVAPQDPAAARQRPRRISCSVHKERYYYPIEWRRPWDVIVHSVGQRTFSTGKNTADVPLDTLDKLGRRFA